MTRGPPTQCTAASCAASAVPAGAAGTAATLAAVAPGWQATLSAVRTGREPLAAARTASPEPARPPPRAAVAAVLGPELVGAPLGLRSHHHEGDMFLSTGNGVAARKGAGWDAWVLVPVPGSCGEYTVRAGDKVLGATAEGSDVCLVAGDDGSGLQRWSFRQTADETFEMRVSGKRDDKVFLGVRDDRTVRLYAEAKGDQTDWSLVGAAVPVPPPAMPAPKPKPPTKPAPAPPAKAAETHVPAQVVPELTKLTGMTEKQIDTVLRLVSLPENSTPDWWKNYDYAEFLGDGRGFTVTLYGACSGTGDLAMILDELAKISPRSAGCDELLRYAPLIKKKRGDDIKGIEPVKGIIRGLGDDDVAWNRAVWKVYVKLYWTFAMNWADKKGECAGRPGPRLTTPAARGFMVDAALNHGADYGSIMYIVKKMRDPNAKDEVAWIKDFAEARRKILKSGYQDLDTSRTGNRCDLWQPLFDGNPTLRVPFKAYKGYWGSYTIA